MLLRTLLAASLAALLSSPTPAQDKGHEKGQDKAHEKATTKSPVDVAKSLASSDFKDATYGHEGKKGQVDDASFVIAVLNGCGAKLDQSAKDSILKVGKLGSDPKEAKALVEKNDPQLAGVTDVIVKHHLGKKVELADAQPGDFVQYWKRNDKKEWYGYAFLIESVEKDKEGKNPKVKLYGAHEGKAGNPIHTSGFELTLKEEDDRKIYVARLEPTAADKKKDEPKKDPGKKDPPKK